MVCTAKSSDGPSPNPYFAHNIYIGICIYAHVNDDSFFSRGDKLSFQNVSGAKCIQCINFQKLRE